MRQIDRTRKRHWYLVHSEKYPEGAWICAAPKAGSTAVRSVVGRPAFQEQRRSAAEIPDDGRPRFLGIREPVARFYSLWRDKCRDRGTGIPDELHEATPDALMDYIEAHPGENHHWARQTDYMAPGVQLVPFEKLLETVGFPVPERRNQYHLARDTDPPMPVERILAHYADDAEAHKRVTG